MYCHFIFSKFNKFLFQCTTPFSWLFKVTIICMTFSGLAILNSLIFPGWSYIAFILRLGLCKCYICSVWSICSISFDLISHIITHNDPDCDQAATLSPEDCKLLMHPRLKLSATGCHSVLYGISRTVIFSACCLSARALSYTPCKASYKMTSHGWSVYFGAKLLSQMLSKHFGEKLPTFFVTVWTPCLENLGT